MKKLIKKKVHRVVMPPMEGEATVPLLGGKQLLVFQSVDLNPNGVEYVRFVETKTGKELLYYDKQEWADEPELVMGAIMGAIQKGAIK
jgi:hypothetical protein